MKAMKQERNSQVSDLDLFLHTYFKDVPEDVTHDDRPDLIMRLGDRAVGIEHSRVYRTLGKISGLEPHAQEVLQFQIVDKAWQLHSAVSSEKLWLSVDFADSTTYRKKEVQVIADSIAKVVRDALMHLPSNGANGLWYNIEEWRHRRLGLEFPRQIKKIDFQVVENPGYEIWGPSYGYVVPYLSIERVREKIEIKEKQLPDYLSKCTEVWLLIVADTGVPSNHFEIGQDLLSEQFSTRFSKVFLMRSFHLDLHELRIVPKNCLTPWRRLTNACSGARQASLS